jgi:DNA-binding LacI/PurR family transcriptional regulator
VRIIAVDEGLARLGPPVMHDVARLAGVSHATVSRVLNRHTSVSADTRARVERAIAQLGYRRNTAARTLKTRSSHTLGVITVDTAEYGPSRTLFAIERAARAAGYFVNFVSVAQVDRDHMVEAIDHLMAASVDGLIAIVPLKAAVHSIKGLSTDVPLVAVEADEDFAEHAGVMDQVSGAQSATQHLLDLGHRTVMHVAGPDEWLAAEARVHGWRMTLRAANRVVEPHLSGDWSATSGYQAGLKIAPRVAAREVTAVFAANDQMALGVLRAMHESDLSVPADVSVVGFDDLPEAQHYGPPLTTVRQDFMEVGKRYFDEVLRRISGAAPEPQPSIHPELVVRASSGPPGR